MAGQSEWVLPPRSLRDPSMPTISPPYRQRTTKGTEALIRTETQAMHRAENKSNYVKTRSSEVWGRGGGEANGMGENTGQQGLGKLDRMSGASSAQ